jgi:hypothetical protein
MSKISTFNYLPNEVILSIFEYLTAAENFHSFFNINDRLRKLVKRYVRFSRRDLDKDIKRFSTLHSWYKHLDYTDDGDTFYLIPLKGEQSRYSFDTRISDYNGIHWHFSMEKVPSPTDKRIEKIIEKYPVKLNPMFSPYGYNSGRISSDQFKTFVHRYYPSQFEALKTTLFSSSDRSIFHLSENEEHDASNQLKYIADNETKRLRNLIRRAARCIWTDLQELEDLNILEIQFR